ncbi:MAG: sugar transferase [Chloroflexota bacterium]
MRASSLAAPEHAGKPSQHATWPHALRLVTLDFLLANVAFALAWWVRYESTLISAVAEENYIGLGEYFGIMLAFAGAFVVVAAFKKLYQPSLGRTWLDDTAAIFSSATIAAAILVVGIFYYRPFGYSRAIFLIVLLFTVVLLAGERWLELQFAAARRRRGVGLKPVLIVGGGSLGRTIMRSFVARPDLGYEVLGFLDDERTDDIGRFRALGPVASLPEVLAELGAQEVIVALPSASHAETARILHHCARHGVAFRLVPDFHDLTLDRVEVAYLHGLPLIGPREPALSGLNRLLKRGIDLAIVAAALTVLSPLLLLVALAIKIDSPGPVLFKQLRVGRGGRQFWFYKFRSMRADAEEAFWQLVEQNEVSGPIFKIRNDPRITRVGRFIRRASIDELPQFLNVLQGDMSLVGPRPPLPHEVERYEDWHRRRLAASPGITGLWQVSGRSELSFDEMVLLDQWYIENWTLGLDLMIILRTIPAVLLERGAY